MAKFELDAQAFGVAETLIGRDEVVALLFNVSDLVVEVKTIVQLLAGDDDGEAEADES